MPQRAKVANAICNFEVGLPLRCEVVVPFHYVREPDDACTFWEDLEDFLDAHFERTDNIDVHAMFYVR